MCAVACDVTELSSMLRQNHHIGEMHCICVLSCPKMPREGMKSSVFACRFQRTPTAALDLRRCGVQAPPGLSAGASSGEPRIDRVSKRLTVLQDHLVSYEVGLSVCSSPDTFVCSAFVWH